MSVDDVFVLRPVVSSDEDAIIELARELDTLNLPAERAFIADLIARSVASFAGAPDPSIFDPERRFVFALEAPDGRVVGTSMILAQHGTYHEPHVFFRVDRHERYAELHLDEGERRQVHMVHTMLTLGHTYTGPTEVGGLVLSPALRKHPQKLGRLLSLGRFLYMAGRLSWFRDRVLAELLPPLQFLGDETRSPLWDALGSRFTGLTYEEADALSRDDKEFIWRLFPVMPVHVSLLPKNVQAIIGQVGEDSRGAKRLLESIGFADSGQIDPFDGGPHFYARTAEINLIRDAREYAPVAGEPGAGALPALVGRFDGPSFRAAWAPVEAIDNGTSLALNDTTARASSDTDAAAPRRARAVRLRSEVLSALGVLLPSGEVDPNARVVVALRPQRRWSDQTPPLSGA